MYPIFILVLRCTGTGGNGNAGTSVTSKLTPPDQAPQMESPTLNIGKGDTYKFWHEFFCFVVCLSIHVSQLHGI